MQNLVVATIVNVVVCANNVVVCAISDIITKQVVATATGVVPRTRLAARISRCGRNSRSSYINLNNVK